MIIDKEKIVARNLFKIIRVSEWKDIIEVREERIRYTPLDPKSQWLMFIDSNEGEAYLNSPFNSKGRYIKLRGSKHARRIVAEYQNLYCNK